MKQARFAVFALVALVVAVILLPTRLTLTEDEATPLSTDDAGRAYMPFASNDPTPTSTPTPTHTPTPTPDSPTPDPADLPCLYALNWWRDYNPPYPIIRSSYRPSCLRATSVDVEHIYNSIGRQIGYRATVERQSGLGFDMDATYIFNSGGGVEGADVTKTYVGGDQYELEITRFCPKVGQLVGYKVKVYAPPYNGQEVTVGGCP